jgi:hypothetical protein
VRGVTLLLLFASGCSNDIVGEWEGDRLSCGLETDEIRFTIDDDLHGEGDVCNCEFEFDVEDRGDDEYRVDVDFHEGCIGSDGKYDCDLEGDGDRLDCEALGDFSKAD